MITLNTTRYDKPPPKKTHTHTQKCLMKFVSSYSKLVILETMLLILLAPLCILTSTLHQLKISGNLAQLKSPIDSTIGSPPNGRPRLNYKSSSLVRRIQPLRRFKVCVSSLKFSISQRASLIGTLLTSNHTKHSKPISRKL